MSRRGIRPRLVAVWLVLLVLVGAIVAIELADRVRPQPGAYSQDQGRSRARMLLPAPVDQLGAIEVGHAGTLHRFERDAAGAWFYHVHGAGAGSEESHNHQADPSVAKRIESAVTAFGRTQIERQLAPSPNETEYGVTAPEMVILVYRSTDPRPLAQYAVGDIAPDRLSRYVRAIGHPAVVTIPNYQIDNLLALIGAVGGQSDQGRPTRSSP